MFDNDRPIKPDLKYIEQCENKRKQENKRSVNYLHKGTTAQLLPCHKQPVHKQQSSPPRQALTKAEQYELIKRRNRQKFGEWQKHPVTANADAKKIKPNQMTVNYKPKVVNIDTRQYKHPSYVPNPEAKKKGDHLNEKMEYKTMIDYMKKLYGELEKEKEEFQKQKQYLKFKKTIQKESGLEIKSKVNTGLHQPTPIPHPKTVKQNKGKEKEKAEGQRGQKDEEGIEEPNGISQIQHFHYPIDKLNECNPFTLREISKYVYLEQLVPENNEFYQLAKQVLESSRANRKVKVIKPNCTHGSIGANHSVCLEEDCAEKRITKFEAGWFELWVAGRFRTAYNDNTGYKLVWYNNGDIKQEFTSRRIEIYHCKAKKVVQVKVGENLPFWYYPCINQLEMKDINGNMEIIFSDGRHEIVVAKEAP